MADDPKSYEAARARLERLCSLPAKDVPCQDDLRLLLDECERLRADLEVAESRKSGAFRSLHERAERLEKAGQALFEALRHVPVSWGGAHEMRLWEEALRLAAPEPRPEGCTCGDSWPCLLHGGPPEDPTLRPSVS